MNYEEIFAIGAAIIVSLGGAGAIILGISKWLGDFIATRLINKYKFKHDRELEGIKSKYTHELELIKSELDKSKQKFLKYSDKQFDLYNSLWKVLWAIKKKTDDLWEHADPQKLPSFAKYLDSAKEALYVNILIIDEEHFKKLLSLIEQFEQFEFGKKTLIQLRNVKKSSNPYDDRDIVPVSKSEIQRVITKNGEIKKQFDIEIMEVAKTFRSRISG